MDLVDGEIVNTSILSECHICRDCCRSFVVPPDGFIVGYKLSVKLVNYLKGIYATGEYTLDDLGSLAKVATSTIHDALHR